ncbi:MAG: hypothetical protein CVV33_02510 [Methanomicrobiales archaeon HGW-Methanomicrobiales-4]|nr:MAG: hypothetical protein CVV33_02510 [Methanomicrobiales archaeon HGW-Methanomicrobiales-4]
MSILPVTLGSGEDVIQPYASGRIKTRGGLFVLLPIFHFKQSSSHHHSVYLQNPGIHGTRENLQGY